MELNVIKRENAIEISLEGTKKIYILNQEAIRDELNWCLSIDHSKLVLNLKGINFIDTTGFRLLIELNQLYKNLNKELVLHNISKEVEDLLQLVKVNQLFGREEVKNLDFAAA